jgi:AcrR family transcriptional regulator
MHPSYLKGQRKRTHTRLCKAYKALSKEKAHEMITATEIAQRASLDRTTFYRYFADKDDVFISLHFDLIEKLAGDILTIEELCNPKLPQSMVNCFEFAYLNHRAYKMLVLHNQTRLIRRNLQWQIQYCLATSLRDIPKDQYLVDPLQFSQFIAAGQVNLLVECSQIPEWYPEVNAKNDAHNLANVCHSIRRAAILDAIPSIKVDKG